MSSASNPKKGSLGNDETGSPSLSASKAQRSADALDKKSKKAKPADEVGDNGAASAGPTESPLRRLSDAKAELKPGAVPAERSSADGSGGAEGDISERPREFLLQRIAALERQLRIRNADCSRLLQERHALLPLKQKCESQAEMIEALQDKCALVAAQHASAMETVEQLKKQLRTQQHEDRIHGFQERMGVEGGGGKGNGNGGGDGGGGPPPLRSTRGPRDAAPSGPDAGSKVQVIGVTSGTARPSQSQRRLAPGGTVVSTAMGPQILYDSSDISSVGFQQNAKLPYDFLGGPAAQEQYHRSLQQGPPQQQSGAHPSASAFDDGGEGAEANRLMEMAKEEAEMAIKYAEVESKEEQELLARFNALKKPPSKQTK